MVFRAICFYMCMLIHPVRTAQTDKDMSITQAFSVIVKERIMGERKKNLKRAQRQQRAADFYMFLKIVAMCELMKFPGDV